MVKKKYILGFALLFIVVYLLATILWRAFVGEFTEINVKSRCDLEVEWSFNERGNTLIKTKNSGKVLIPSSIYEGEKTIYLSLFLKKGDLVSKEANTDVISVRRQNKEYEFRLRK